MNLPTIRSDIYRLPISDVLDVRFGFAFSIGPTMNEEDGGLGAALGRLNYVNWFICAWGRTTEKITIGLVRSDRLPHRSCERQISLRNIDERYELLSSAQRAVGSSD